ncbi:MAG: tRNA (uridine(34)/cytosine(34)/5-carboxymethylaminomethyluridine(34)-2'-O)-methyltransferase TrmL [Eubacteriales bacterium]
MALNIVLVNPEIPSNTGNIARTCAITGAVLHLIKPLGFSLEDKYLKRAGLDYWSFVDVIIYENLDDFMEKNEDGNFYFLTTKAKLRYSDAKFQDNDYLFFGAETKGLPEELLKENYEKSLRIPMKPVTRSLNLANSANIVLYEALRQLDFPGLSHEGHLTEK